MRHEKIIKRADGSRVKISVEISVDFSKIYSRAAVYVSPAGKRSFSVQSVDGAASVEEIRAAKIELLDAIKKEVLND